MALNQNGFTFLEILIAITIGMILIGIAYSWVISIEQKFIETEVLLQVLTLMQHDIVIWRNHQELYPTLIEMENVTIQRNVQMELFTPHRERAYLLYYWEINGKPFSIEWYLERYLPLSS